jgi:secondary thiamine-phosphate synthase enzyme
VISYVNITTNEACEFIDITQKINEIVKKSKVDNGICCIFIPHTTAGITINENADPDVRRDIIYELNKIVPIHDNYKHIEGNSAAHIKASMMGFAQSLIIQNGKLLLGTWQGVYFCEFDGPRQRKAIVKINKG